MAVFPYSTPLEMKQAGQIDELQKLMGKMYPEIEVNERIEQIVIRQGQEGKQSLSQTFCDPVTRRAAWVGCALSAFQQLSGINMIIFFSSQIFSGGGGSSEGLSPNQATALVMGVNFLATVVASGFLNIFGRKTLNLSMTAACTVFLIGEGVAADESINTLQLVMCLGFVVCFEFGPGPVVWMYMSEIMNDTGVSMGVFINWFLTLLVGLGSPSLSNLLGGGNIFILFGGF
jgi:hypothetical protein